MAKVLSFPHIFLRDATTDNLVQVSKLEPGAALVPRVKPEPILGGYYKAGHLTVYVNGSMPLEMRSAVQDGCTETEAWLVDELPQGIWEIDWTDCRREFSLLKAA